MALITFSPSLECIRGHVAGFVFKLQQGRKVLAKKPEREPPRDSPDQLAQQDRFRQGTDYANGVKYKPEARAVYEAMARKRRSNWFAVAISDWMNPPEVKAIDVSGYHQHAGDIIWVRAEDKIGVAAVTVAIADNAHNPVENGAAVLDAASGLWKYTATMDASGKAGLTVTVTALDRPGHTGTLSVTK